MLMKEGRCCKRIQTSNIGARVHRHSNCSSRAGSHAEGEGDSVASTTTLTHTRTASVWKFIWRLYLRQGGLVLVRAFICKQDNKHYCIFFTRSLLSGSYLGTRTVADRFGSLDKGLLFAPNKFVSSLCIIIHLLFFCASLLRWLIFRTVIV